MKIYFILAFYASFQLKPFVWLYQQCPPAYSTCNLGKEGFTNVHIVAHTHVLFFSIFSYQI